MEKITLTERDGLKFDIDPSLIEIIRRRDYGSDIMTDDGTQIAVKESLEEICRKVVAVCR